jgi:hypothetical protein
MSYGAMLIEVVEANARFEVMPGARRLELV